MLPPAQPRIVNYARPWRKGDPPEPPLTKAVPPRRVVVRVVWASGAVEHIPGWATFWRTSGPRSGKVLVEGLRSEGAAVTHGGWFDAADVADADG